MAAKGGGSEAKAKFAMLNPSDSIVDWVLSVVPTMGAGWCPPGLLGIGIGGTPEKAMVLAKESMMDPIDIHELQARAAADPGAIEGFLRERRFPIVEGANGEPERYFLGFFLMGAYQDVMGDLHNLFGTVNEVHVFLDPDESSGYYIEEVIEGTSIVQALAAVQYDETELKRKMKAQVDAAIRSGRMRPSQAMRLFSEYERGLREYTYLSF